MNLKTKILNVFALSLLTPATPILAQELIPSPADSSSSTPEKSAPTPEAPAVDSSAPIATPESSSDPKKGASEGQSSPMPSPSSDIEKSKNNLPGGESSASPSPGSTGEQQQKKPDKEKSETKTTRRVIVERPKSKIEEYGTSLIFSADLGLLSVFPALKLKDYGPKYGLAVEGKALGSVLLNKFLIDAGFGWGFFNVTGLEPLRTSDGVILTDDSDKAFTDETSIKLSGSIFEIAPGYRIRNNIFAGPVLQFRYPSDLAYDSTVVGKNLGIVLGAQGGYQIFDEDLNTRFVGRMMFTLNDSNWLGLYTMVGVQVGLPFTQPEVLTIKETTTETKEKRIVEYRKREFKIKVTRDLVKMLMDNLILFYDDPTTPLLTTESQSFLVDLVQTLTADDMEWGILKIDTISRQHGRAIRDALVSAGLPTQKIRFGTVIPGPRTTNPPVEFGFHNVKDQNKLTEALREAMREMQVREECEKGQCNN